MKILIYCMIMVLVLGCITSQAPPVEEPKELIKVEKPVQKEESKTIEQTKEEPLKEEDLSERLNIYFIQTNNETTNGDAILIMTKDLNILVDAGPQSGGEKLLNFLKNKSVKELDIFVTTSPSFDQYGGLTAIKDKMGIKELWKFGLDSAQNKNYNELIESINAEKVDLERGYLKNYGRLNIKILNPGKKDANPDLDINSVTMKISYGDVCIILTSELGAGGQRDILNRNDIHCQILQIADHGFGNSNRQAQLLVKAVSPKVAIISGGKLVESNDNSREPVRKLLNGTIDLYETYVGGNVLIQTDGIIYEVKYD